MKKLCKQCLFLINKSCYRYPPQTFVLMQINPLSNQPEQMFMSKHSPINEEKDACGEFKQKLEALT